MTLNAFDWAIIIIYLIGMIGLSFFLACGQKTGRDYYLGGNKTAPLLIALSTIFCSPCNHSILSENISAMR
jgi:Na+/proline symporter